MALGKSSIIISHANAQKRLLFMPQDVHPTITFVKQISLFFNGEKINILHYPHGHTDNDVVVFFTKSNIIHLGDLWNSGISSFPTVDIEAGGSVIGMLKNIRNLIRVIPENARIIPGHYAVSDLKDLKATRNMLVETIGIVMKKKSAGMSLEQIKKEGFPPKYDSWGTAYTNAETWIENIYHGSDTILSDTQECQKESKRSIRRQKRSTRMKKGIGRQKLKVDMSWSTFLRENSPWVRMMD
jgi:hypothetical protein